MDSSRFTHLSRDVTAEACAWIAQLETGELTRADVEALREWMRRSPRHTAEIRRLARLSADLNALTDFAEPLQEAVRHHTLFVRRPRRFQFSRVAFGAVATAACAVIAAVFTFRDGAAPPVTFFETAIGGYEVNTLVDGSVVSLNTDTRIAVTFDDTRRSVNVLKGEAYFQVAHDRERPFVVRAGNTAVEAVGTAFAVRLDHELLRVTVTEGQVKLADARQTAAAPAVTGGPAEQLTTESSQAPAAVLLTAGQSMLMTSRSPQPVVETVSEPEINRRLSWRERMLEFSDTPLEEVVRELSRHTTQTIEIADPALREMRFGGIFPIHERESLFDTLETAYAVRIVRTDDRIILMGKNGGD